MTGGDDNLTSIDIVPVRCPRCGEAQNTLDGSTDPLAPSAHIGCMVCGHVFQTDEYRRLIDERRAEMARFRAG